MAAESGASSRSESLLRIALRLVKALTAVAAVAVLYLALSKADPRLTAITGGKLMLLAALAFLLHARLRKLRRNTFGSAELAAWPGPTLPAGSSPQNAGLCMGLSDGKLAMTEAYPLRPHVLAIASTGSGKTTSLIRPNILLHAGASLVLDVKGEITALDGAELAAQGRRVLAFDPEGLITELPEGVERTGIDMASGWQDLPEWEGSLAEACIEQIFIEASSEPAFAESARILGKAVLATCLDSTQGDPAGLFARLGSAAEMPMRELDLLLRGYGNLESEALQRMARAGALFMAESNERLVTASIPGMRRQLEFIESPRTRESLSGDYSLGNLLDPACTDVLLLVLPASALERYGRVLRLVFGTVGALAERKAQGNPANLLAAIDEAAALGKADWLLRGLALHRSYGISYLLAFQSLGQLEQTYGKIAAREFMANCATLYFGVRDYETAALISRMLGERTAYAVSREVGFSTSASEREVAQAVLSPQEILQLGTDRIIGFLPNAPASILGRISPKDVRSVA